MRAMAPAYAPATPVIIPSPDSQICARYGFWFIAKYAASRISGTKGPTIKIHLQA